MKKYIIFTLKKYVPLYAVTFAICMSLFFTTVSLLEFRVQQNSGGYLLSGYINSGIIFFAVPMAILTTIVPLFANTYRYSLKGADLFYQTAKGKKSIRYVNNIALLCAVMVSFTVAYMFSIFLLFLRQIPFFNIHTYTQVVSQSPYVEVTYDIYAFNFWAYIPVYILLLIAGIINYFISYFLVTRANNFLNSLITLILGQTILGIGLMTPIWYISIYLSWFDYGFYSASFLPVSRTATIIGPIALIFTLFDQMITGYGMNIFIESVQNFDVQNDLTGLIMMIICSLAYIAMGVIGLLFFLKENESSGEIAGKAIGRDKFQIIIFHVGFGLIGLWVGMVNSSLSYVTSYYSLVSSFVSKFAGMIFFGAIYYVFLGLLRRNFRINKKQLIIMISSLSLNFVLCIASLIVSQIAMAMRY